MPDLKNKTILIISPQDWGKMFISKHHYAIALASHGNEVFFLNPPDNYKWNLSDKSDRIRIEQVKEYPGLNLVWHKLFFPYQLKFHAKSVYDFLMKKQVRDILSVIKKPIDILWSFDLGHLYPLYLFDKKTFKIFHPVDEPSGDSAIHSAEGADIIFSVTKEILDKYNHMNVPRHFINHGLADVFLNTAMNGSIPLSDSLQIGLSGNFLRTDLDRTTLLQIIHENPSVIFNFFGSYTNDQTNIGGGNDIATKSFIADLSNSPNVKLHGALSSDELAKAQRTMDAFLICYDIKKDQSRGTNYHKVMEYLSTGKVIIANSITTYSNRSDLVTMIHSRENNAELPALFKKIIYNVNEYNIPELQEKRIDYARQNTYLKQLDRIEEILKSSPGLVFSNSNTQ